MSGDCVSFASVVVDAAPPAARASAAEEKIEIVLAGAVIRVPAGIEAGTLATILHVLLSPR
jgi:hypothetical protein